MIVIILTEVFPDHTPEKCNKSRSARKGGIALDQHWLYKLLTSLNMIFWKWYLDLNSSNNYP